MISNDEHLRRLDQIAADISRLSTEAQQKILELIKQGIPKREAVRKILLEYGDEFTALFAAQMSVVSGAAVTIDQARKWPVGNVTLARTLYRHASQSSAVVTRIVKSHVKGFQDARKLSRMLYEGYGFTDADLGIQGQLPKYLRKEFITTLNKYQAKKLKTPALRASYLQAIDAMEKGVGQAALDKALRVAVFEKNRYIANRIAQTELARSFHHGLGKELMQRDDVQWVQFRMSASHPKRDICDLYANQDRYGLGPGIYPKGEAPVPPLHPFCLCGVFTRLDLMGAKGRERPASERTYLNGLTEREQGQVVGSKDKAVEVRSGVASASGVLNRARPDRYKIIKAKEL